MDWRTGDQREPERVLFSARPPEPPGPDVAHDLVRYRRWLVEREERRRAEAESVANTNVTVSVLLIAQREAPGSSEVLEETLGSLAAQPSAPEICLAFYGSPAASSSAFGGSWQHGATIRRAGDSPPSNLLTCGSFDTPAEGAQAAFLRSSGEAVLLLEAGDQLRPLSLPLLTRAFAEGSDVVYADEDRIDPSGEVTDPQLKPGWSPELLLSNPYLGRPVLVRRSAIERAGGFRPLSNGDWEHDLQLRLAECAGAVTHVPEVLCRRPVSRSEAAQESPGAVTEALRRRNEAGLVQPNRLAGGWTVLRSARRRVSVSIVVPLRDAPSLLRACTDTLFQTVRTEETALELLLIDNGSVEPETFSLLEQLDRRPEVRVISDGRPFNWAALNNSAAAAASGELLLFLNNDIEARHDGWLEALSAQAIRPQVAAVGARLLYPNGQLQHVGLVVGLGGAAGHVLSGLSGTAPGYLGMAVRSRECSAVTGACLMTRHEVFDQLGGFDEGLGLDLNDVDYCLRAWEARYRTIVEAAAELVHHESPSRGTSGSAADIRKFLERWDRLVEVGDPYLHPALTRLDSSCALRGDDEEGWWRHWRSTLPLT